MSPLTSMLVSATQDALTPLPACADQHTAQFQASLLEHQHGEQAPLALTQQMNLQVLAMAMDLLNDSFTVEGEA
ncbi:hypothetical protein DA83_21215 [Pseudomonas sp. 250J]|uniref:hypothetical protein n=1 Tax=Pseudomonas TaxID=286 RepID=UPI00068203F6|nr:MULTISPECIES: hypothetical protein [Pseudomonas]KNX78716.1 hypothetical protein DA83_21215 [Pseudomonas sp. 250J]MCU7282975.1 hypothetical protein [Pseudomonas peradeniyensis]QZA56239.1 hypothetical protein K2O50_09470 [Pseudomonas sp. 2hn]